MFCRSLFVLLSFFFWSLCCLFFFDIRILITPLVSSNSSYLVWVLQIYLCLIAVSARLNLKKRYSVRLYPQLFAGWLISYCVVFDCLRIFLFCFVFAFSVPYCPLRCPHKNDVWFVFTPADCRKAGVLYALCVCLYNVVSNTS